MKTNGLENVLMKTNTAKFAERELEILKEAQPDSLILPFTNEVLALCEKFGDSGQSGGSAPFTAGAISRGLHALLLQRPISPITGEDDEWDDVSSANGGNPLWQNKRCSAIFKTVIDKPYYQDAISWKEPDGDTFHGRAWLDNQEITSWQPVNSFPFSPKTFYVDVERVGDKCLVKDREKLEEALKYYG